MWEWNDDGKRFIFWKIIMKYCYNQKITNVYINDKVLWSNENKTEHNKKWLYIPDHLYRILIIGGSGSGKTNALFNLIEHQADIDKIDWYAKGFYEAKYQYFINIREKVDLDHHDDPEAFIQYSNDM